MFGQQTMRTGLQTWQERAAKAASVMSKLLDALTHGPASGCPMVVVVQSTHHWKSAHLLACSTRGKSGSARFWYLLPDALMGSSLVEVHPVLIQNALELLLVEDEQMVEACLPHTPQRAFADGIGSWCMIRRFQYLDIARCGHASETGPKFAIVISNEIFRCLPIRGRFSQLLRHPRIGRKLCHSYMDDLPRMQFDEEEGKERSKEEIGDLQEVTGQMCAA